MKKGSKTFPLITFPNNFPSNQTEMERNKIKTNQHWQRGEWGH